MLKVLLCSWFSLSSFFICYETEKKKKIHKINPFRSKSLQPGCLSVAFSFAVFLPESKEEEGPALGFVLALGDGWALGDGRTREKLSSKALSAGPYPADLCPLRLPLVRKGRGAFGESH